MECKEIIDILEGLAPKDYACSWDNPGLIAGGEKRQVKKILVALDATNGAINKAVEEGADLLITHHPIVFSPIKKINDGDFLGEKLLTLIENRISCYAMHTNYDIAGGMAEICGGKMGLKDAKPFEAAGERGGVPVGIGQVGFLPKEMTLGECAEKVKEAFGLPSVQVFGPLDAKVKYAAVSPGSGRHMIEEAGGQGVDVLITGDIGHHEGLDSLDMGFFVIEAGHYGLEQVFIDHVAGYLAEHTEGVCIVPYYGGVPWETV